jgi:hypothetical protein
MRRAFVIALCAELWTGCVDLPEEEDLPAFADAASPHELAFDGGLLRRPPTGKPYDGPQCAPSASASDGGSAPGLPPNELDDSGTVLGMDGGREPPGLKNGQDAAMEPSWPRPTQAGDIVITEIMVDPMVTRDDDGEWIELWNARADEVLSLEGCMLDDGAAMPRELGALIIEPHSSATLARSDLAGFTPDLIATFALTNTADTVAVLCEGVEIDRVRYDKEFPFRPGASMSLDPESYSASANDDPAAWCAGAVDFGGDRGTPGESNPSCAPLVDGDGGAL